MTWHCCFAQISSALGVFFFCLGRFGGSLVLFAGGIFRALDSVPLDGKAAFSHLTAFDDVQGRQHAHT